MAEPNQGPQQVEGDPVAVDDKIIQRILFIASDILSPEIMKNTVKHKRFVNLDAIGSSGDNSLVDGETADILKRQAEIFSDSMVTSEQAAYELFSDNETTTPIDTEYTIHTLVMLFIGGELWYFDVDKNNAVNQRFIISKIKIKNNSKDTFTLKANYQLTLTLNFTSFDDLLADYIEVINVKTRETQKISAMNLLYNYWKERGGGSEFDRHRPAGEGIYICQVLKMLPNSRKFQKLKSDLQDDEVWKTYHLTYYKHNFEMFKNEDPIFKFYENQLTIDYVAYEADGVDKPINTKAAEAVLPKVNFNMYNLLSDETSPELKDAADTLGTNFARLQTIMNKKDALIAQLDSIQKYIECKKPGETEQQTEEAKKSLSNGIESLKNLQILANRALIFTILNSLRIWRLTVPYKLIGVYSSSNFWEAFTTALMDGASSAAGFAGFAVGNAATAATIGAVAAEGAGALLASSTFVAAGGAALTAAAPIAVLAGVGLVGYAVISAFNAKKTLATEVDSAQIKKVIKDGINSTIVNGATNTDAMLALEPDTKELFRSKGNYGESKAVVKLNVSGDISANNKTAKESVDKLLSEFGKLQVLDESALKDGTKVPILFTTLGQIIRLVLKLDKQANLYILSGGFLVDEDIREHRSSYVYFDALPITINSLTNFLQKEIEDKDRKFHYDSEIFLRDIYDNLVKSVLMEGFIGLESVKEATPKTLRISSTVHLDGGQAGATEKWLKPVNLTSASEFNDLKINFLKSKNLNLLNNKAMQGKLVKIYTLGTIDEIKHYDFYKSFTDQATKAKTIYNSLAFQAWINRQHLMPCLLMRNIANTESILKKKFLNFSRIDNSNLNTGNFLNSFGQLRFPYEFKGDFKAYMSFFADIGTHMFVAPPGSNWYGYVNLFGFGGLYIIRSSELEYNFQVLKEGGIVIPNLESKYMMDGYMLSHGDKIYTAGAKDIIKEDCEKFTATEPAAIPPEKAAEEDIDLSGYGAFAL